MKKDILYINSVEDIRLIDALHISNKDKELPNQIILTIQSAGAGQITPVFSKDASGTTVFSSIDEIGTKFILDGKEVTSDDFQVVTKSQYGMNYNFFGLQFEDSNEHTLKISLVNSKIPNFQRIDVGSGYSANSITSVVISNSITEIGDGAFSHCSGLTSVIIPNSVTSIGETAFKDCSGLTSITIPDSVKEIGEWAFSYCYGLTSVTIGNSVTEIGESAFYGCSSLTSVIIPNSVTKIRAYAFEGTAWYNNQPNGVVYAGKVAYNYKGTMPNGTVIELIDGCIGIAEYAFSYRPGLTSVTIPNLVTEIGGYAFSGCSGLTSITSLATTAPVIQVNTFQNIKTSGTLHVPAGSDYSAWMSTGDYYLGKYNWTKVEDA